MAFIVRGNKEGYKAQKLQCPHASSHFISTTLPLTAAFCRHYNSCVKGRNTQDSTQSPIYVIYIYIYIYIFCMNVV